MVNYSWLHSNSGILLDPKLLKHHFSVLSPCVDNVSASSRFSYWVLQNSIFHAACHMLNCWLYYWNFRGAWSRSDYNKANCWMILIKLSMLCARLLPKYFFGEHDNRSFIPIQTFLWSLIRCRNFHRELYGSFKCFIIYSLG